MQRINAALSPRATHTHSNQPPRGSARGRANHGDCGGPDSRADNCWVPQMSNNQTTVVSLSVTLKLRLVLPQFTHIPVSYMWQLHPDKEG